MCALMTVKENQTKNIPTQSKNRARVIRRRRQIVDAAVPLFLENGFHKTTARRIVRAAGQFYRTAL